MLRKILAVTVVVGVAMSSGLIAGKAGRWAGKGAAGGAIAGLLIGGDLGGAAVGAAVGAAGAGAAGAASSSKDKKQAQQQADAEAQAQAEAEQQAARSDGLPESEEEWIVAIGEDNVNALEALVDCEYDRATMLAKVSSTSNNAEFRTVGVWLEALTALDQKDRATAEEYYEKIVPVDDEIDTVQQASLKADQAILRIRDAREDEGISCTR